MTTLAGSGLIGSADGIGQSASFITPDGIAADTNGRVFITEWLGQSIRQLVIATGAVTVVAGLSDVAGWVDGVGTNARFNNPAGIAVDLSGKYLFVTDCNNHCIRQIVTATGVTSTLAGNGVASFANGIGSNARFNQPLGITIDSSGNHLFVADFGNFRVRKIVISTVVASTVAGSGADSFLDGLGASAAFGRLQGIVIDSLGNLFVSDFGNDRIRLVNGTTGLVSTLAGSSTSGFADGIGTQAIMGGPTLLALDRTEKSLFVAEQTNSRIRQIVISTQKVTSAAGNGSLAFADGVGSSASFKKCFGVAVDVSGIFFVTDYHNSLIRQMQAFSACQVGQYCPPASAVAIACPIGSFCATTGLSAPIACTAAYYCNTSGLSAVSGGCNAGYYCPSGSSSPTQVACAAGYFCASGSAFNVRGAVDGQGMCIYLFSTFCFTVGFNSVLPDLSCLRSPGEHAGRKRHCRLDQWYWRPGSIQFSGWCGDFPLGQICSGH